MAITDPPIPPHEPPALIASNDPRLEFGWGDRVRKARNAAGLTQQQLADRAGISDTAISNWEKGHTRPNRNQMADYAARIAGATGVSEMWLLGINAQTIGDLASQWKCDSCGQVAALCGCGPAPICVWDPDTPLPSLPSKPLVDGSVMGRGTLVAAGSSHPNG